ncbi:MAG: hypothetical protein AB8H80_11495 [Planctomycetota bacterium]
MSAATNQPIHTKSVAGLDLLVGLDFLVGLDLLVVWVLLAATAGPLMTPLCAQQPSVTTPGQFPASGYGAREEPAGVPGLGGGLQRPGDLLGGGGLNNLLGGGLGGGLGQGQGQNGGLGQDEGFGSIWSRPEAPRFQGFPVFPSRLNGYGGYPLPLNPNAAGGLAGAAGLDPTAGFPLVPTLAPAEPMAPSWPSWVRTSGRAELPFATDRALLIGGSGRVWHRAGTADAFIPLMHYDKFAALATGGECEVRHAGSLELLLHTSTDLRMRGLSRVRIDELDDQSVRLTIDELSWLLLKASARNHSIVLPDGSVLEFEGSGAAPADAVPSATEGVPDGGAAPLSASPLSGLPPTTAPSSPPSGFAALFGMGSVGVAQDALAGPAMIEIVRVDEPRWYGGRAYITNLGGQTVTWRHAHGETRIESQQRVVVLLQPPKQFAGIAPEVAAGGDTRALGSAAVLAARRAANPLTGTPPAAAGGQAGTVATRPDGSPVTDEDDQAAGAADESGASAIGGKLAGVGAKFDRADGRVVCKRADGMDGAAFAEWCGVRVALPAGVQVEFESLQGNAFGAAGEGSRTSAVNAANGGR